MVIDPREFYRIQFENGKEIYGYFNVYEVTTLEAMKKEFRGAEVQLLCKVDYTDRLLACYVDPKTISKIVKISLKVGFNESILGKELNLEKQGSATYLESETLFDEVDIDFSEFDLEESGSTQVLEKQEYITLYGNKNYVTPVIKEDQTRLGGQGELKIEDNALSRLLLNYMVIEDFSRNTYFKSVSNLLLELNLKVRYIWQQGVFSLKSLSNTLYIFTGTLGSEVEMETPYLKNLEPHNVTYKYYRFNLISYTKGTVVGGEELKAECGSVIVLLSEDQLRKIRQDQMGERKYLNERKNIAIVGTFLPLELPGSVDQLGSFAVRNMLICNVDLERNRIQPVTLKPYKFVQYGFGKLSKHLQNPLQEKILYGEELGGQRMNYNILQPILKVKDYFGTKLVSVRGSWQTSLNDTWRVNYRIRKEELVKQEYLSVREGYGLENNTLKHGLEALYTNTRYKPLEDLSTQLALYSGGTTLLEQVYYQYQYYLEYIESKLSYFKEKGLNKDLISWKYIFAYIYQQDEVVLNLLGWKDFPQELYYWVYHFIASFKVGETSEVELDALGNIVVHYNRKVYRNNRELKRKVKEELKYDEKTYQSMLEYRKKLQKGTNRLQIPEEYTGVRFIIKGIGEIGMRAKDLEEAKQLVKYFGNKGEKQGMPQFYRTIYIGFNCDGYTKAYEFITIEHPDN